MNPICYYLREITFMDQFSSFNKKKKKNETFLLNHGRVENLVKAIANIVTCREICKLIANRQIDS